MSNQTPESLKQSLLDQIDVERKAVEALSDEELEMVAGGLMVAGSHGPVNLNMNTGAVPITRNTGVGHPINTHVANINTGVVRQNH